MCIHIYRGPTRTKSRKDTYYFMTIIDDYSRRVWIFFVVEK